MPAPRYTYAQIQVNKTRDDAAKVYLEDQYGKRYEPDSSGLISNVPRKAGDLTLYVIPAQDGSETFSALSGLEVDNRTENPSYAWGQDNTVTYTYAFEPTEPQHTVTATFTQAHVVHVHVSGGTADFPNNEPNNKLVAGNTNYRVLVEDGESLTVNLTKQSTAQHNVNIAVWEGSEVTLTDKGSNVYEYTIQSVDKPGELNVHFVEGETVAVTVDGGRFEPTAKQTGWWCSENGPDHEHMVIPKDEINGVDFDLSLKFSPDTGCALKGITLDNTPQDVSQLLDSGKLTANNDGSYTLDIGEIGDHNRTVYVQFVPLHTVTFTSNNSSVQVMDGDAIPENKFPNVPDKEGGRTFFGWKDTASGRYYDKNTPVNSSLTLSPDYKDHVVTQPDGGPPVIGGSDFTVHLSSLPGLDEDGVKTLAEVSAMDAKGGQIDPANITVRGLDALQAGVADGKYPLVFTIGTTSVTVTATVTDANPEITGRTAHTLTFLGEPNQTYTIAKADAPDTIISTATTDAAGRGVFTGLDKATQYKISHTLYGETTGWTSLVDAKDIAKQFAPAETPTGNDAKDHTERAENSNVTVTVGPDGNYLVTLKQDIGHTVEVPDIWGTVNVELNGHSITGGDATENDEAQPGLLFTRDNTTQIPNGMTRPGTGLSITDKVGKGEIKGGDGCSPGNPDGAPGVVTDETDAPSDVVLTVGAGATVVGGSGADGTQTSPDGGSGGAGIRGGVEVAVDGGAVVGGSGGSGADGTGTDNGGDGGTGGSGVDTTEDVTVTGGSVTGGQGGDGGSATEGNGGSGGAGGGGVTVTVPGTVTVGPGSVTGGGGGDGGETEKGTGGDGGEGGTGVDGDTTVEPGGKVTGGDGGEGGRSEEGGGGTGGDGGGGIDGETTVKPEGEVTGGGPGNGGKPGQGTTDPVPDGGGTITNGSDVDYGRLSATTTTVTVTGPKVGAAYTIYHSDGITPVAGVGPQTGQTGKDITFTGLTPGTQYVVKADAWSGTIRTGSTGGSGGTTKPSKPEDGGNTGPEIPDAPGVADPDLTGVSALLNTKDHMAYMLGYDTGLFGPSKSITRAEVAQVFYRLLLDKSAGQARTFSDVPADAWYYKAVVTLAGKGILLGYEDGLFRPEQAISRAEFAAIAARCAKASTEKEVTFPDVPAGEWYYKAVRTAVSYGWINGYEDGTFQPGRPITRAETAAIVNRMLARIPDYQAVNSGAGARFPDVPASHWAFYDIAEASTEHDYTRTSNTGRETWR